MNKIELGGLVFIVVWIIFWSFTVGKIYTGHNADIAGAFPNGPSLEIEDKLNWQVKSQWKWANTLVALNVALTSTAWLAGVALLILTTYQSRQDGKPMYVFRVIWTSRQMKVLSIEA